MKFMQLRRKKTGRYQAWLEMIRIPGLCCVPGDFLAGAALAAVLTGTAPALFRLLCGTFGAAALYAFGTIYYDVRSQSEDCFRHPSRPLPSGRISSGQALAAAVLCLAAGLLLFALCGRRSLICAAVLAVLTAAYDSFLKDRIEASVVSTGICRGLFFLTGTGIGNWHPGVLPVFLSLAVYSGLHTWFADGQERHQIPDKTVFYPAGVFVGGWVLTLPFLMFAEHFSGRMLGYAVLALLISCCIIVHAAVQIYNRSVTAAEMGRYVSRLEFSFLPWQAGWVLLSGEFRPAAVTVQVLFLLLCCPLLRKYFRSGTGGC